MPKRPIPKLVSKLRFLCKQHPLNAHLLKSRANRILKTNEVLNIPPERFEATRAYTVGKNLHKQLTGKRWLGEEKGSE